MGNLKYFNYKYILFRIVFICIYINLVFLGLGIAYKGWEIGLHLTFTTVALLSK